MYEGERDKEKESKKAGELSPPGRMTRSTITARPCLFFGRLSVLWDIGSRFPH